MAHYLGRLRAALLSHLRQWPRYKLVITAPLMLISGLIRPALNLNSSQLTSLPSSGHTHAINFSAAAKLAAHLKRRIYSLVKNGVFFIFMTVFTVGDLHSVLCVDVFLCLFVRVSDVFYLRLCVCLLSNCRLLLRGRGAAGARSLQRLQQIDPACSKYDTEGGR